MKKLLLIIVFSIFLVGCQKETFKLESELVQESKLFQSAYAMKETFIVCDIEAQVTKALTNPIFIGNNKNNNMMGVYIYIDYPKNVELSSSMFSVVDLDNNEYHAITADGLDFLGMNRGEGGNQIGYYRVSLPTKYKNFLLKYNDKDTFKYVHFIVESGE